MLISLFSKIVSPYSVKCLPKVQGNLLGKHRKLKEMAPVGMAFAIPTGAFIQTNILGAGNIHTEPLRGNRPRCRTNRTIHELFTSNAAVLKSLRSFPMRISDAHGERQSVLSNLPPFVEIRNPDGGVSSLLRPTPSYRKGHVLQIIVGKEYAFQVVENDLDGPVGGIPYLRVVTTAGGGNEDLYHGLLKMRERSLFCRLPKCGAHHVYPVFLYCRCQFFLGGQGLLNRKRDGLALMRILDDPNIPSPSLRYEIHIQERDEELLALYPDCLDLEGLNIYVYQPEENPE